MPEKLPEMKKCPFCGGEATILKKYKRNAVGYQPMCRSARCGALLDTWATKREAILAWNARAENE